MKKRILLVSVLLTIMALTNAAHHSSALFQDYHVSSTYVHRLFGASTGHALVINDVTDPATLPANNMSDLKGYWSDDPDDLPWVLDKLVGSVILLNITLNHSADLVSWDGLHVQKIDLLGHSFQGKIYEQLDCVISGEFLQQQYRWSPFELNTTRTSMLYPVNVTDVWTRMNGSSQFWVDSYLNWMTWAWSLGIHVKTNVDPGFQYRATNFIFLQNVTFSYAEGDPCPDGGGKALPMAVGPILLAMVPAICILVHVVRKKKK